MKPSPRTHLGMGHAGEKKKGGRKRLHTRGVTSHEIKEKILKGSLTQHGIIKEERGRVVGRSKTGGVLGLLRAEV